MGIYKRIMIGMNDGFIIQTLKWRIKMTIKHQDDNQMALRRTIAEKLKKEVLRK